MKNAVQYVGFLFILALAGLVNLLPSGAATFLARALGSLLFLILAKRRKIAFENLEIVYGNSIPHAKKEAIVRETFRNFSTSIVELVRMPVMLREAKSRFEFEGMEHLERAFEKGKGVILVISHLGSWEYLAFLPYLQGYPCSVIVRPIKNKYIYEWIQNLRRATNLNPIDRTQSVREILRELKQNHLVAILIDQWAGPEGLWIDFFGKATSATSIPARLANKTGAALVPAYCLRISAGHYKICAEPAVPVEGGPEDFEKVTTVKLNRNLERQFLTFPEQWIWTHRRWKDIKRYRASGVL